jgi:EipB-like
MAQNRREGNRNGRMRRFAKSRRWGQDAFSCRRGAAACCEVIMGILGSRRLFGWVVVVLVGFWSPALAAPVSDVTKGFLAHRAIYDVKLAGHKEGVDVSAVSGRLVYEFNGTTCEGFSTQFRFVTRMVTDGEKTRITDMRTSSFEDAEGASFDFLNQTYTASILSEDSKGSAQRDDKGITATIARPKAGKVNVAGDALFPTQHLAHLIEAAKAGETVVNVKLYDGTEGGEHAYFTTSVIGKELPTGGDLGDESAAKAAELAGKRSWPVSISYFDESKGPGQGESTPDYQLGFVLYENGVSRHMKLDYGDFVLEGHMTDFTVLPQKPCP